EIAAGLGLPVHLDSSADRYSIPVEDFHAGFEASYFRPGLGARAIETIRDPRNNKFFHQCIRALFFGRALHSFAKIASCWLAGFLRNEILFDEEGKKSHSICEGRRQLIVGMQISK